MPSCTCTILTFLNTLPRIPNHLFGDFLTLLQFFDSFAEVLEVKDSFGNNGISFDILERALIDRDSVGGPLYEVLSFLLASLFDLQVSDFVTSSMARFLQ